MQTFLKLKRYILAPALFACAATLFLAIPLSAKQPDSVQSPENSGKKTYVTHNGNVICVGNSAVPAHKAHGDAIGGPCTGGG